jgi:hypothetical protein
MNWADERENARLDELTPNALPRRSGSVKRKADFDSPVPKRASRSDAIKTPGKAGKIDGSAYDAVPHLAEC